MTSRYPAIKRDANGKMLCRGCGGQVPKGRRTWCSSECFSKHSIYEIKERVWQRDRGTCQHCKKFLGVLGKSGKLKSCHNWYDWCTEWVEFDHIKEYADGGATLDENMQVLCAPCHQIKTTRWRKNRKKK